MNCTTSAAKVVAFYSLRPQCRSAELDKLFATPCCSHVRLQGLLSVFLYPFREFELFVARASTHPALLLSAPLLSAALASSSHSKFIGMSSFLSRKGMSKVESLKNKKVRIFACYLLEKSISFLKSDICCSISSSTSS